MKKNIRKIIQFAIILICGIQLFRYMFPPFEMIPSTFDIYEGEEVVLDVKPYLGIYEYTINYGTHEEVKPSWGKYEYTIHNNTSEDWLYGNSFILEVKRGSEWKSVHQDKVAFTLAALNLPANSSVSGDLNLNFIYGKLPVGKYRIVKDVNIERGRALSIAGEFRVWF